MSALKFCSGVCPETFQERQAVIRVAGVNSSFGCKAIEKALAKVQGVDHCQVDVVAEKAFVRYFGKSICSNSNLKTAGATTLTAKDLCNVIKKLGFDASLIEDSVDGRVKKRLAVLRVGGMTCSNCSGAVEKALNELSQIDRCQVDLINERASVWYTESRHDFGKMVSAFTVKDLCNHIEDIGFEADVIEDSELRNTNCLGGHARLHVLINMPNDTRLPNFGKLSIGLSAALDLLQQQFGVLEASEADESYVLKVVYNPEQVGARCLLDRLRSAGFDAVYNPQACNDFGPSGWKALPQGLPTAVVLTSLLVLICDVLPSIDLFSHMLKHQVCPGLEVMTLLVCFLSVPVQIFCGRRFHVGAYHSIVSGVWDMNVLIALGTAVCFGYALIVVLIVVAGPHLLHKHCTSPPASYFESPCLVITFMLVGKSIENWARSSASLSLRNLLALKPAEAHLISDVSSKQAKSAQNLPVDLLEIGDIIQIFPGEISPADGMLSSQGPAEFDESVLTGESRPIVKQPGDVIIGGSKCISGHAEVRIEKLGSETVLSKVTTMVQQAQLSRAPVQRVADMVAHRFVPFIVILAIVTWILWYKLVYTWNLVPITSIPRVAGSSWPEIDRFFFVLEHGLTVLLVACPCALGLATPTAVMAATGVAAEHGILIRSGALPLELGSRLQKLVLDKTGTLTIGSPQVKQEAIVCPFEYRADQHDVTWQSLISSFSASAAVVRASLHSSTCIWLSPATSQGESTSFSRPLPLPGSEIAVKRSQRRVDAECAFWWALGSAELSSEHPLAKELVKIAKTKVKELSTPDSFKNMTGIGVHCVLAGSLDVLVGSPSYILFSQESKCKQCPKELNSWVQSAKSDGCTVVMVAINGLPLGAISLRDTLCPQARSCVAQLEMAGIEVWMCTGDHRKAAEVVAIECGIDLNRVVSDALPVDKVRTIQHLQGMNRAVTDEACGCEKTVVAMVGDGINDAPALATADVGIAIGAGQNITVDAADVVLVRSDLRDLSTFLSLSKKTLRTIWCNFLWAFIFNISALPIAAGVLWPYRILMTPQIACILMLLSSLFVVLSSLSLRWFRPVEFSYLV